MIIKQLEALIFSRQRGITATYLAALVGGLLLSTNAVARNYNYEDIPLGERSFGMGHACVAVAGDVSNMFYNPATLADIESSQVSASLSAYERIDTRTGEFVSIFRSAADNVKRGGFLAIPSMVGGNLKWGNWQWGGSILVPYLYQNSGTVSINTTDAASFESRYSTVWMGAFLARKYGRANYGLSLFYASHEVDEKFYFITGSSGPLTIRFVERSTNVGGLIAIIGGSYDFGDKITLGYSFRFRPFVLGGSGEYSDATSGSMSLATADEFQTKFFPVPVRFSLGGSWQIRPDLLLAADIHAYGPVVGNYRDYNNPLFALDAQPIANFMVGAEYFYWKDIGFRMGLFTNLSAARFVPNILTALDDKVHMFGTTAAIVFDKDTGSISLGGYIEGGQGSSATIEQSPARAKRSNYVYGFVVASNYKF